MAKWNSYPQLASDQLDGADLVPISDDSEAETEKSKTASLDALRTFLGAGITVGVTQASHGLSVGDVVRFDGTDYVQATADTASNAEAVGVVTLVDGDDFAYQTAGVVSTLSGLTPGDLYYLQDDGSLGTSAGTVEKPILIATSATSAVLILAISGAGGGGGGAAEDVTYNPASSGLSATDVQAAIDELAAGESGGGSSVQSFVVACSDESSDLTTGAGKVTFRMPFDFTLTGVRASLTTAATGSGITVDINENGSSILSTKLTIDAGEKTSTTAATPPVISDTALADDAEITIDIDAVGSTTPGRGLKVTLIGTPA